MPAKEPEQVQIFGNVEKGFRARFGSEFARTGSGHPSSSVSGPGASGASNSTAIDGDHSLFMRVTGNGIRKIEVSYDPSRYYVSPADLSLNPSFTVPAYQEKGLGITTLFQSEQAVIMNERLFTIFPYQGGSRPGRVILLTPDAIGQPDWLKMRVSGANGDVAHYRKTDSRGNGTGEFAFESVDRWRW
jgi:hypothetical protein